VTSTPAATNSFNNRHHRPRAAAYVSGEEAEATVVTKYRPSRGVENAKSKTSLYSVPRWSSRLFDPLASISFQLSKVPRIFPLSSWSVEQCREAKYLLRNSIR
jgi:hypothetical protein